MNHQLLPILFLLGFGFVAEECTARFNYVVSGTIRAAWERERFKNAFTSDEVVVEETEEETEMNDPLIRGPCFTKCSINVEDRRRCDYTGSSKTKCLRKNCCWDDDEAVDADKRCYRKEIGICPNPQCATIPVTNRITCLVAPTNPIVTHSKEACIRAQCCWDEHRGCYDMNATVASFLSSLTSTTANVTPEITSTVAMTTTAPIPSSATSRAVVTEAQDSVSTSSEIETVTSSVGNVETVAATTSSADLSSTEVPAVQFISTVGATFVSTTRPETSSPASSASTFEPTTTLAVQPTTEVILSSSETVDTSEEAMTSVVTTSSLTTESSTEFKSMSNVVSTTTAPITSANPPSTSPSSTLQHRATVSTLFPDITSYKFHQFVPHRGSPSPTHNSVLFQRQTTFSSPSNAGITTAPLPTSRYNSGERYTINSSNKLPSFAQDKIPLPSGPHATIIPGSPKIEEVDGNSSVKSSSSGNPEAGSWWESENSQPAANMPSPVMPGPSTENIVISSDLVPTFGQPDIASYQPVPPVSDNDNSDNYDVYQQNNPASQNILNRNVVLCWFGSAKLCKLSLLQSMSTATTNQQPNMVTMARNQPITSNQIVPVTTNVLKKTTQSKPADDVATELDIMTKLCQIVNEAGLDLPAWKVSCNAMKAVKETTKKPLPSVDEIERGIISAKIPGSVLPTQSQQTGANARKLVDFIQLATNQDNTCGFQRMFQTTIKYSVPCYSSLYKKIESEEECLSHGCCWTPTFETVVMDRLNVQQNSISSWLIAQSLGDSSSGHVHCIRPLNGLRVVALYAASLYNEQQALFQTQSPVKITTSQEETNRFQTQSGGVGCGYSPDGASVSCGDHVNNMADCLAMACCWLAQSYGGYSKCYLPRDISR